MKEFRDLNEVQTSIKNGTTSCIQLVEHCLARIREKAHLNAFLEVYEEEAKQRAREIDEKFSSGTQKRLAGLVIGLKDNICYQHHKVYASSRILENFESLYSATAVDRILNEDAIIIGRLNCDEFAMGSSNENSAFGPVKNPRDETRVPGGSSGGSAVAVASDLCHATLGSDTGGSIRQPASFCGVIGLKPTYGRVSRYGLIAYGSTFDQIGPITKSPEDVALILEIIAGKDDQDSTSSSNKVDAYTNGLDLAPPVNIAYPEDCLQTKGLHSGIREFIYDLINKLKNNNTVKETTFPYLDESVPTYQIISNAEASSNLARYDGILYGRRAKGSGSLEETLVHSRTEGFGEEVKRRIMLGTFVLSEGYYEAYYTKAQKVRKKIKDHLEDILEDNDFIILPTTPGTAFKIGKKSGDPIAMYMEDLFTVQASLAGLPAISLPLGKDETGLPFGVQIITRSFEESRLLAFSKYLLENYQN